MKIYMVLKKELIVPISMQTGPNIEEVVSVHSDLKAAQKEADRLNDERKYCRHEVMEYHVKG